MYLMKKIKISSHQCRIQNKFKILWLLSKKMKLNKNQRKLNLSFHHQKVRQIRKKVLNHSKKRQEFKNKLQWKAKLRKNKKRWQSKKEKRVLQKKEMKEKKVSKKHQRKRQPKNRKSLLGWFRIKRKLITRENKASRIQSQSKVCRKALKRKNSNFKSKNLRKRFLLPIQRIRSQPLKKRIPKASAKLVKKK